MRKLILTNGQERDLPTKHTMRDLASLIGAETLDTVLLRHMGQPGMVMVVDDNGHEKNLPINLKATMLYHANCQPGMTHQIRGNVAIVPDGDFE